ncbi:P-loop nucleoside triphosphate hydrolases superfamily protein with CH domain-containing protein [Perilla frutescens var. hirtella]|uniref:P-loop nucleoside triphosphate hydrolases superfamily protein with CH domain-containing protein n=1 Tax=Perilla frutescens var. hirtella TaxID=608512 RepID=A0AAD4JKA4_PERFH|nr:P-loop nucleoside triphosphate hydrolases superfamily protein with CH domain-containing protein [Perilla frutescens var. hirtella]
MDPHLESRATEHREGALSEVRNGNISGRIEIFNGLAEGNNSVDVLQSKNGHYWDLPASKISELMKLGNLEKASIHSLFTIVKRILDDRIEKKDEDIPQRVASVLKLVLQEIEQQVSKQADNMRKQSILYKSREDRYHSKIRALETLATGTTEENEVVMTQLQQMKVEKAKIEENKRREEQDLIKLRKEKDGCESQILSLNEKLMFTKTSYEENLSQLESKAEETKNKLEKKILELECLLTDSKKKVKELEDFSESKLLRWKRKEQRYRQFIDSKVGPLQELRLASESIKQEVSKIKNVYAEEFFNFGLNLKGLVEAAENYHSVLEENRKLYNEVQDLKGNIRVYCRVRPFLSGQNGKQTTMQYIGENGELVVINPSKPGKDSHRLFKFNKVFGPASTQEEVFRDTQPLIRSVLDGYNVCIFAYGQTGSGKTYTMTGPNMTSVADWGVNYRALNDLFNISQKRHSSIAYEIAVQMVEIYNEQVRDLLCNDSFPKRYPFLFSFLTTSLRNHAFSLAICKYYCLHPVKSTGDVLELMTVGLMNRSVGATALNERSSRSHSILTVHVRGTDLETDAVLRGCLHLVDLAGSERVDRSEAKGDRLREAQHINKSLSALGDVIFALAQKNAHVPYRNSKLTQVLQSSLGGQAKTLMFVQLNPDVESYSETISTLKFAERVSGVELGAARSNKEGRGIRELMEQVASLKDAAAKKDDEIGRLRSLKVSRDGERRSMSSPRCGSASPRRHSAGARSSQRVPQGKSSSEKAATDLENSSDYSEKHSEAGSQQSVDDFKHHKEFFRQSRLAVVGADKKFPEDSSLKFDAADGGKKPNDDIELLGFGEDDSEERLSDISDGVLSMGTETDASVNSIVEYTLFPEKAPLKPSTETTEKPCVPVKIPKPPTKQTQPGSSRSALSKSTSKIPSYRKATATATGSSSSAVKATKRWH